MELFAADGHDASGCERVTGKSGMRPREPLVGRKTVPAHRLGAILREAAAATVVHDPEVELRVREPLVGRKPIPPDRFGIVRRDTKAIGVHGPEVILRLSVTLPAHARRQDEHQAQNRGRATQAKLS